MEEVLYAHPEVQECAVIGTPDKEWGERVTAFILPKPGRTIDQRELKDFSKARLSAYKVPKRFFLVDDFPRSPAGKFLHEFYGLGLFVVGYSSFAKVDNFILSIALSFF